MSQRSYKKRQRDGVAVLRIAVPEYSLIESLIAAGRLGEVDGLDRRQVELAVEGVLRDWIERWQDDASP
jgi:hypothetical protein